MYIFKLQLATCWDGHHNITPHKVSRRFGTSHISKDINRRITGWFKFKTREMAEKYYIYCIKQNTYDIKLESQQALTDDIHTRNNKNKNFLKLCFNNAADKYKNIYPELFLFEN